MSAHQLITDHLDLWTQAVTQKSTAGRGSNGKVELTGIKKLRELILELAVRGKLVEQDPDDEPASRLLERIAESRKTLIAEKRIKNSKPLPLVSPDEFPSELPLGWVWTRLGSIAEINPRNVGDDSLEVSFIPMPLVTTSYHGEHSDEPRTWSEIKKGYSHFANGDVGLAKITPCFENSKAAVFRNLRNGIGAGTTELHVARPLSSAVSPYFLLLFLKSPRFLTEGEKVMTGSAGQKRVPKNYFSETPLPLPPEKEQHRIVQKVDELMALCDRLEQHTSDQLDAHETLVDTLLGCLLKPAEGSFTQSANATELADNWARLAEHFDTLFTTEQSIDKLKQAILQLAVMGRLVEQDAGDEPASILLGKIAEDKVKVGSVVKAKAKKPPTDDCRSLSQLPRGWVWVRIQSLLLGDTQNGLSKKADKNPEGVPLLRISAATTNQNYIVDENDFNLTSTVTEEQLLKYKLEPQDLLAVRFNGNRSFVGRTALFQGDKNNLVVYPDKLIRLRFPVDFVVPRLVSLFMNSRTMREEIEKYCATTVGNWGISAKNLKQVFIPLPPLAEQHRIVQKVDELMALCDHLKQRLTQASNTRSQLAGAVVEQAIS